MTRTEAPRPSYSPRRLKVDKENVQSASKATPSPSKRSLRASTGGGSTSSATSPMIQLRTPPGSSKLLRQHFQQMSMAASSSGGKMQQRRCHQRLLDSGAVRVLSPRRSSATRGVAELSMFHSINSSTSPSPPPSSKDNNINTHHTMTHNSRVGILRSRSNDDNESAATDQSFGSYNGIDWTLPSPTTPPRRRMDCMDPVAFTLLRGGDEDPAWLMEQDRSSNSYSVIPTKVSASLSDLYGGDYTRDMARPVAVMARRQF